MMRADAEAEAHQELVDKVVRRLSRELDLSCDPEDLRAWGQQGLLEARQRFDASRGVRFSTFAYYRVRGAVIDGVRKQGWLRRRAYAKLKAYEAADRVSEPVGEQEAQQASATVEQRAAQVSEILGKISAAYLLSALGQGDDATPETPEEHVDLVMTRQVVNRDLAELPERERVLLQAVYFEGATIEEAGARMGLSKSWASRMHAKALDRMRKSLTVSLG
ncbi:MAG TPA: sigma-70 family RNA polymerase sigma factor [Polyangiales bacterium]|nr:sigma-70 family RNA polymerase sigma factor [Polyangiales bacterium]